MHEWQMLYLRLTFVLDNRRSMTTNVPKSLQRWDHGYLGCRKWMARVLEKGPPSNQVNARVLRMVISMTGNERKNPWMVVGQLIPEVKTDRLAGIM